jgi:uncharacterized protein (DUF4415 family)
MQRVTKQDRKRRTARGAKFSTERSVRQREGLAAAGSAGKSKRLRLPLEVAFEFYRPLKKPITVRIDADVLAWFKKDGRRYQTRINAALRKVMEREMKAGGR